MSISSVKTGAVGVSLLAGNTAYDPAATWLIERVNGTGSANTITFSNIPQTYQHLQIRYLARSTQAATTSSLTLRINGDSTANYAMHGLAGDGASATAAGEGTSGGRTSISIGYGPNPITGGNATANVMATGIIDLHDYASTTKNKTVRNFTGYDLNGSGAVALSSGAIFSTSAITSLTFTTSTAFASTSTFALYGFKGE